MMASITFKVLGVCHAEYPAVNLSAQTSPDTRRKELLIVYVRAASQRGSYIASIVIDLHTTLGEVNS
jgi:hypothetical protein